MNRLISERLTHHNPLNGTLGVIMDKLRISKTRRAYCKLFACIILGWVSSSAIQAQETSSRQDYRLDAGDIISISVYEESDLSFGAIRVTESGEMNYPLLGRLVLKGLTVGELEQKVRDDLVNGEFLIQPEVTVSIVEYRPFYIDGEVNNAGGYPYEPGLTVRMAVSIAGGFTDRASRTRISIITSDQDTTGRSVNLDTLIKPGDVVTVGQRFF